MSMLFPKRSVQQNRTGTQYQGCRVRNSQGIFSKTARKKRGMQRYGKKDCYGASQMKKSRRENDCTTFRNFFELMQGKGRGG